MLTVGLIKELFYIAKVSGNFLSLKFKNPKPIEVAINPSDDFLDVYYNGEDNDIHIWGETIEGGSSMFGVESCDSISRIIACIENKDDSWKSSYYYNEKIKERVEILD